MKIKSLFFSIFFIVISSAYSKTEVDHAFTIRTKNTGTKFTLYSPDMFDGKTISNNQVYDNFGCNGKNISPKLVWKNEPEGTKSFAITIFDRTANTDSGWWHWSLYNIPRDIHVIPADASDNKKLLPKGTIQGLNDYGERKFGGVCKTDGKNHEYVVTLYALNVEKLVLPKKYTTAMLNYFLNLHKISTAEIIVYYPKSNESSNKNDKKVKDNKPKIQNMSDNKVQYKLDNGSNDIKNNTSNIKNTKNVIIEEK